MNVKQNLHTHTNYCDGVDSPQEMVEEAIKKGFGSIGFSGHSYAYYDPEHSMSIEGTEKYKNEIYRLKEEYKDKIKIFCGLEFDMYSKVDLTGYDYLIGAVHYLLIDDEIISFDCSQEIVEDIINKYFNGNGMNYARAYYDTLAQLPEYGKFDIIGHFDLITKHSDNIQFFDENLDEYKRLAVHAAEKLAGKIPYFEVNTGAIARGYRKMPYPSLFIIKELKKLGFKAIISSDCHNKNMLDCCFDMAIDLLKEAGYKERYILTENGFVPILL